MIQMRLLSLKVYTVCRVCLLKVCQVVLAMPREGIKGGRKNLESRSFTVLFKPTVPPAPNFKRLNFDDLILILVVSSENGHARLTVFEPVMRH